MIHTSKELDKARKDGRMTVELFNDKGEVCESFIGESMDDLQTKHQQGTCDWCCGFCYTEGENYIKHTLAVV